MKGYGWQASVSGLARDFGCFPDEILKWNAYKFLDEMNLRAIERIASKEAAKLLK